MSMTERTTVEARPKIDKGLDDVYVKESSICLVDGVKGRLLYRGWDIRDLAEHSSFESCRRRTSTFRENPSELGVTVPMTSASAFKARPILCKVSELSTKSLSVSFCSPSKAFSFP